jgi:Skp family chaperone for outer membrane proteins
MIFNLKGRKTGLSKIVIFFTVFFILTLLSTLGVGAQNIGLVDLNKINSSHPNTKKINELSQELRVELQTRQEQLNQEGKGLEETELMKLEEKFNAEWEPVKQKMLAQLQALQAERNSDILQAIKAVGEKGNYQIIINSEVPVFTGNDINEYPIVLYGGDNVTQDVIAEIEKIVAS